MEEISLDILNLVAVLAAAWIGGMAARKLGYPAILGELMIGILLGPGLLGWIGTTATVEVLSEVGIILLMVYIGIEIDFKDLGKASKAGLLAALGGFFVPFIIGYYIMLYYGESRLASLFVAIAMGVTSLATKSRILVDLKLLNTRVAYVLMAGALISDTLALIIFAGITSFADAGRLDAGTIIDVTLRAAAFFAVTISIGIYVLPKIGSLLSRSRFSDSTLFFTVILLVAFGYAELAELAGMHSILGAFMAGLFIKESLFTRNISREVNKTFYDVSIGFMAPIFFVTSGFHVTLDVFTSELNVLLVVFLVAVAGKIIGTALFYLPSGYGWREGVTVGAGMNGRGAVEIIIAGVGMEMGIIDREIFSILVFMAIFTTATVPFLLKWTTDWLKRRGELTQVGKRKGYVIIGVNPLSLLIASHLKENSPVYMIDTNKEMVNLARESGINCINGNALREEVMAEAQPEKAEMFIGLTTNTEINILGAQLARDSFLIPQACVAVSQNEDGAGMDLLESVKATSMFAQKVRMEWFQTAGSICTENISEKLKEPVSTRDWVKKMTGTGVLPLIIIETNGYKRPFHYGTTVSTGERVIFLKR